MTLLSGLHRAIDFKCFGNFRATVIRGNRISRSDPPDPPSRSDRGADLTFPVFPNGSVSMTTRPLSPDSFKAWRSEGDPPASFAQLLSGDGILRVAASEGME